MNFNNFLARLINSGYTLNEISILLELGYGAFTRGDLLSNPQRCPVNTYSPSALTRTLKKLLNNNPPIVSAFLNASNRTVYQLVGGPINYNQYQDILLTLARSKVLTLNTIRVALRMILNKNKLSTARFLAGQLDMEPDYLASTVLSRMLVIGLIESKKISSEIINDVNHTSDDRSIPDLDAVRLNLSWGGNSRIILL